MQELRNSLNATLREQIGVIDARLEIIVTLGLAEIERRLTEQQERRLRELIAGRLLPP